MNIFRILINSRFIRVQRNFTGKMTSFSPTGGPLVIAYTLLISEFISITANKQDISSTNVCSPQNPDCYFERFANFKIPQVDPVKASIPDQNKIINFDL